MPSTVNYENTDITATSSIYLALAAGEKRAITVYAEQN